MRLEHSSSKDLVTSLQNDFDFLTNSTFGSEDKSLWEKRLNAWFKKLSNNGKLCEEKLKNFRNLSVLLSEVPRNPYNHNPILGPIYEYLRRPGYRQTCLHNFKKISDDLSLDWEAFSDIGNPLFEEQDGKRFNERFLRHLRTVQLIKKYVPLKPGDLVVDVGGGYGQFISMLLKQNASIRAIIIDLPQQLFLARYFLLNAGSKLKINSIEQAYNADFYDLENLQEYDVLLIPTDFHVDLSFLKPKLYTNFSSFGEMPKDVFENYINNPLFKNSEYFFTVNRLDSFPTYSNRISVLDYLNDEGNILHFEVSKIWDDYYESFSPFIVRKKSFVSRNFELIFER